MNPTYHNKPSYIIERGMLLGPKIGPQTSQNFTELGLVTVSYTRTLNQLYRPNRLFEEITKCTTNTATV